jgi:ribosomal protein S18 acetylase RimI-like enzyme
MGINIERISGATPEVVSALGALLPHLSESAPSLDAKAVGAIVAQHGASLLVARGADNCIVGTVTVVCFQIPSGRRARIESLIVAPTARRIGVGRALCKAALEFAKRGGAKTVDLTSSHSRVEANALYLALGFSARATNVYRLDVAGTSEDPLPNQALQADEHLGRSAPSVVRR